MVEETYRTQFIEGINEGEHVDNDDYLNIGGWSSIAIEYKANLTYALQEIEIANFSDMSQKHGKYEVKILPDYKGLPYPYNDLVLTNGIFEYGPDKVSTVTIKWTKVILNHAVALVANKTYWLALTSEGNSLFLVKAHEGNKVPMAIMNRITGKWRMDDSLDGWEFMLRFYGNILMVIK